MPVVNYGKHNKEQNVVRFILVGLPFIQYEGQCVISRFILSCTIPSSKIQFMNEKNEFIQQEECAWTWSLSLLESITSLSRIQVCP